MRQRHECAIAELHRHRRVRIDHLRIGADHEQRAFRVQRIGQEAHAQGRGRPQCRCAVQVDRQRRAPAQRLQADPHQVGRAQRLHHGQYAVRMRHQQRHAEHRVQHMDLHPQRDAKGAEQPGAAAVQVAVAGHHGEVRAGADHGEHGHGGNRQRFGDWNGDWNHFV
ncbi:hypothetical protein D3C72_1654860 [compost metagenome]